MKTIAERLKEGMEARGFKQTDIVERTGINKGALSSYLRGKYEPKQNNIYKIAKALNVNEAWLMGYDVAMERDLNIDHRVFNEPHDRFYNVKILLNYIKDQKIDILHKLCKANRIKEDLTERAVAEKAGISLNDYLKFENNKFDIGLDKIFKIIDALDIHPSYIEGYLVKKIDKEKYDIIEIINKFDYPEDVKKMLIGYNVGSDEDKNSISRVLID